MPYRWTGWAAVTVVAALATSLHGSSTRFFRAQSQADLLGGEAENLSIDSRGHLRLAPETELMYESSAPFLWALAAGTDGALFVGTGNEGRVFRVDGRERGSLFFDAGELEAHALAPAPDGGLYVGTSPDGRVYKVEASGEATTFFEPEEHYIWALTVDDDGVLYVATGDKGIVYRVTPDGRGEPFYEARASNVTSLAVDASGRLFIGTESPGQVLSVNQEGRGFVLLDSPFQEIRALRFDSQGDLYVAAVNGSTGGAVQAPRTESSPPASTGTSSAPVATVTVSTEVTAVVTDTPSGPQRTAARDDSRLPRGAIYRITPDGLWDELWESRDDSPYDLLFDEQHRLVVGTGSRGQIFRLEGDPLEPTLLATAEGEQVTALYRGPEGDVYFATANPGKLFRLAAQPSPRGSYESLPLDAAVVSTWGTINWHGITPSGSRIEMFTRSGNTATPDDTWSEWSEAYTTPDGSPVTSPNARYLQWRVVLSAADESPTLISVSTSYLQRNLRPQIGTITVHPPGIVFQKPFSSGDPDLAGFEAQTTPERALTADAMSSPQSGSAALGRRTYGKGLQTIVWQADDGNGDDLVFDLLYRREGDDDWSTLRRELTDSILVWDTTTVPDGTYFVRIVASDSPSNVPSLALVGVVDSVALEIDNTPPTVLAANVSADGNQAIATFEVRDDHSPIQRVEVSRDGVRWQPAFPIDGIGDSRNERYQIVLEEPLEPRGLTIRAIDGLNNVGTAHIEAPRP